MKILLFGANGQVGWELQRSLAPLGTVVALGRHAAQNPEGLCGDIALLDALVHTVRTLQPNVIVNAAAYTDVDRAQSEPELARAINALAPGVLAAEAQRLGAWLVHYSTDYVFDGSGTRPWREDDIPGPLSVYGSTKLEGEQAVAGCARHLIFRTSWVYAARGKNFARTMLRLAQERDTLHVVDDQVGAPTGAELLADVTAHALRQVFGCEGGSTSGMALSGVYHLAADGCTSWFGYAKYVLGQAEKAQKAMKFIAKNVKPMPSTAFSTAAVRPHNSRLDTTRLQTTFCLRMPHWQAGVARMLKEIDYGHTA